jgi:hypothetical protein
LLGSFATLKMEVIRSSETSGYIQTTRRYVSENGNIQTYFSQSCGWTEKRKKKPTFTKKV